MDFKIDDNQIQISFDKIARELLLNYVISVNNTDIEITDIEFYYFKKDIHEDMYTHDHKINRPAGQWRSHNQGIDITFEATDDQDGGILIRGIRTSNHSIIGPLNSLHYIFEIMKGVFETNQLCLKRKNLPSSEIIKTFRHLPNKEKHEYRLAKYRYIKDIHQLELPEKLKSLILSDYEKL